MALKIVYKICCGIDIHKTFVVACIATTNSKGITTYKSYHFSTYTKGLKELLQWLLDSNCKDVCMESTGKYWIPVYNVLEKSCSIVLAHPKYVKATRGKKTDKKHFQDLESRKTELEELILAITSPYQQELDLILTAPSFKNIFSAITVISEIGVNMEAFPSAKYLCSWARSNSYR